MSQEAILVTGAAGGVGSTAHTAIATLLKQGRRVRAMVRKLDTRADALRDLGAEVVVADMLDIIGVRAAMKGCSAVYFTMSISPTYLEAAANVAVTAKSLMGQLHRDNRYDRMNDTYQQLVGRAPIAAGEFARRHAAAFMPS
jgi:uncharacterized protein YbjT (DUF2867 family)